MGAKYYYTHSFPKWPCNTGKPIYRGRRIDEISRNTGDILVCTFADDHGGSFSVESKITTLTKKTLVLKMEDEVYEFKKK